jgi:hypothetical protein
MDDKYSDASITLTLAPSRRARIFILGSALATMLLLAYVPGDDVMRLAAAAWCVAMTGHACARHKRATSLRIVEGMSVTVDGREGEIVGGSFVAHWLTIVHWRPRGGRISRTLVVLPDMVDTARFRRLRVILRWGLHSAP